MTPSSFATYLLAILAITFATVFAASGRSTRYLGAVVAALSLLLLYATYTRSAWLAAATDSSQSQREHAGVYLC